MPAETPRNVLKYTVRSEKGKFVLSANTGSERRKKSVLSASTDDERLDSAVRLASIVAGLFLVLLGFGGAGLAVYGIRQGGISALFELLAVILFMPVVGLYGIDLVGRGILGRQWSRRYWTAAEQWLRTRLKLWHGVVALLLLFGWPLLGEILKVGFPGLTALMIPLAIFVQVLLHEMGHLAAAGSVGYRPRWLAAGPLIVHVDGPRPRLSLSRSWMMLVGGLATYEPVRPTRGKDCWVILAGPLVNLLAAELALEAWDWPNDAGFSGRFLRTFVGFGIAMGLFNLIPLPRAAGGFALDGRELLDRLRGRR